MQLSRSLRSLGRSAALLLCAAYCGVEPVGKPSFWIESGK